MKRVLIACLIALAGAVPAAATPDAEPGLGRLEAEVLAALNLARSHPEGFAASLRAYRGLFRANIVMVPGAAAFLHTQEGIRPVDEALDFLGRQTGLEALEPARLLAQSAGDLAAEQSEDGRIGHVGADGSAPGQRAQRHGGGRGVAEVIAYGATDAIDVIRQLIVDDGVPDRGHRSLIFAAGLHYAGVSCRPHPVYRTMCVIDMAETPDGSDAAFRFARR